MRLGNSFSCTCISARRTARLTAWQLCVLTAPSQDVLIHVGKVKGRAPIHRAIVNLDVGDDKTEKTGAGAQFKDGSTIDHDG